MIAPFSGYWLINPTALEPVGVWSRLKRPNIVQVREAFTSQAFSDKCTSLLPESLSHLPTDSVFT
jgi:hypothetical protein